MSAREPDRAEQEEFAGRMVQVLNDACLGFMISIGHRTGLFDTMAGLAASTCADLARAAGLHERYVREWLGAMVVGGIVEYDPGPGTYRLPPEHAAALTRAAGPENLAGMMQYLALMGEVEEGLVECFRKGGGMPYSAYPRFQELQAEESGRVYDLALVDGIVPLAPGCPSGSGRASTHSTSAPGRAASSTCLPGPSRRRGSPGSTSPRPASPPPGPRPPRSAWPTPTSSSPTRPG